MKAPAGVALLVAAGIAPALWLAAEPAAAQPPPPPTTTAPVVAVVPGVGVLPAPPAVDEGPPAPGESLIPDSGAGRFPTSHYDVGYDPGAWNNLPRKFFGLLTELAFGVNRWLVGIGLWIVPWAYRFGVASALGDPA